MTENVSQQKLREVGLTLEFFVLAFGIDEIVDCRPQETSQLVCRETTDFMESIVLFKFVQIVLGTHYSLT